MTTDKYIHEDFLDKDYRTENRVVHIKDFARDKTGEIKYTLIGKYPKYSGTIVQNERNPKTIGRHVTLSQKSLDKNYLKISH